MESTNLSKSNYVSSYDSKVARLGQGVDIKFSQGSGTSTERVKIAIVLHEFGESSDFLNFAICVYPRTKITDMRKKSGPYEICGADWRSG